MSVEVAEIMGEIVKRTKRGNWTDDPCFYVSVVDGPKFALLAGPFRSHQEALDLVRKASDEAEKHDPRAVFYAFGTVKMMNGYRDGILNQYLGV